MIGGLFLMKAYADSAQRAENEKQSARNGVQTGINGCERIFDQTSKLMKYHKIDIDKPFKQQLQYYKQEPGSFHIQVHYDDYKDIFSLFYNHYRESAQVLSKHKLKFVEPTDKMQRGLSFFEIE